MITPVTVPLLIDRGWPRRLRIAFRGIDLTGAAMHAQIRLSASAPGDPIVNLPIVSDAALTGLRLVNVATVATVTTSIVDVQLAAMVTGSGANQLPAANPESCMTILAWDLFVGLAGRTSERWITGAVTVTDTVTREGALPALADAPLPGSPDAIVAFDAASVQITMVGIDAVAPLVAQARGYRDEIAGLVASLDVSVITAAKADALSAVGGAGTTQAAAVNAAGTTQIAAVAAIPSSAYPILDQNHAGFVQQPGAFRANGGYVLAANASSLAIFLLDSREVAARAAGTKISLYVPARAGALVSGAFLQRDANNADVSAAGTFAIDGTGSAVLRNVTIAAGATQFLVSVTASSAGATIDDLCIVYGEPTTPVRDATILAQQNLELDRLAAIPLIAPSYFWLTTYTGTPVTQTKDSFSVPPGSGMQLAIAGPLQQGKTYSLVFTMKNLPIDVYPPINLFARDYYSPTNFGKNIDAFTQTPTPRLRRIGRDLYQVTFTVTNTSAQTTLGLAVTLTNANALLPIVFCDFKFVEGSEPPLTRAASPVTLEAARKADRNYMIASATKILQASPAKLFMAGSSLLGGYDGNSSNMGLQLATHLTNCTVVNNGVPGSTTRAMLGRWNSLPVYVTFAGGSIPADTSSVAVTLSEDIFTSATNTFGGVEPYGCIIASVAGVLSVQTRDGGGNPLTFSFARTAAGTAVTVTAPLLVTSVMGEAARFGIQYLEPGRNDIYSSDQVRTVEQPEYLWSMVEPHLDYMAARFKQIVVALPLIAVDDADIAARLDANSRFASYLPCPTIDLSAPLNDDEAAYMATRGYSGARSTNGVFPAGLRQTGDGNRLHQNLLGNIAHAYRLKRLVVDILHWIS